MVVSMAFGRRVLILYSFVAILSGASVAFAKSKKRSLPENDYGDRRNVFLDDEDTDGYQEIKEKLRNILAQEVEPQREGDFHDYVDSWLDLPASVSDNNESPRERLIPDSESELGDVNGRKRQVLLRSSANEIFLNPTIREQGINSRIRSRKRDNVYHANLHSGHEHTKHYLNEWMVHLTGGRELATSVAKDLGYRLVGQVGNFKDIYRLVKMDHPTINKRDSPNLTHQLNVHAEVKWAEQQFAKERSKRAIVPKMNLMEDNYDPYAPLVREKRIRAKEEEEEELKVLTEERKWLAQGEEEEYHHQVGRRSAMAAQALQMEGMFNDELWDHQWYLFDTRSRSDLPKLDLQVLPVWEAGVTGQGVRLLVLDDGLEWSHTDIISNYDAEISYDFNDDDDDPSPRYDIHLSNSHGTRCAGEIAMMPNNRKCGVGISYGASVGGVRMLDGPVSDAVEGASLGWALDKVDIMTCSWGPTDDGRRVEGPGRLALMAIEKGVTEGRGGKGIVYVWAAGNGGSAGDDCNCDGYTSSIYTLSISSASETGQFPWYGERCASTLAAAYSSGAYTDQKIATTDLHDSCTDKFSGTSAAAPLAAGIFALALEVNPDLTWRDMQHAVVWSSEWAPLGHNSGWYTNSQGLRFNPRFGFGLLSADGLVQTVQNWTRVPEKVVCRVEPTSRSSSTLVSGGSVVLEFEGSGCEGTLNEIRSLEHVQIIASFNYTRRGALSVSLTSPSGTWTRLLNERVDDNSQRGFEGWSFMSVHTWGEDPRGLWHLNIYDNTTGGESGSIGEVELVLHGTKDIPEHMKLKRSYRIPFEENNQDVERDAKNGVEPLTAETLRTMPWEELIEVFTHSTRSTFSESDIKMLLQENRLEDTLRNILLSEDDNPVSRSVQDSDMRILLDEMASRK